MSEQNLFVAPEIKTSSSPRGRKPKPGLGWLLFSFEGRIPRSLFWAGWIGVELVATVLGLFAALPILSAGEDASPIMFILAGIWLLIVSIPTTWALLAIQVKRFHDRGKSGWWVLIGFIPYIGAFWIFIDCGCLRGTVGPNQYGPDPT